MRADAAVVDASALAAFLFGEPQGPEVATRLGSRALFAPSLIRYELASVCLKKQQEAPDMKMQLQRALDLFSRLAVQEVHVSPADVVDTARQTGLTAYDAAYLWLAKELKVELVTLAAELDAAAV